jgi:dihydroneopterin aldolase
MSYLKDLAENIFRIIFQNRIVKKSKFKIEKLDIIKNSESVGIDFSKSRI